MKSLVFGFAFLLFGHCSSAFEPINADTITSDTKKLLFNVLLDKKPVGTHGFEITRGDGTIVVNSKLQLKAKFLGLFPVNYNHESTEYWKNGCIVAVNAKTTKRGKTITVKAKSKPQGLEVLSNNRVEVLKGCIKSFAYWDPLLLKDSQLLNTENGDLVSVQVETTASETDTSKTILISSSEANILLGYDVYGQWLSLRSKLNIGGELHYIRR
jgi:hypothetical protein